MSEYVKSVKRRYTSLTVTGNKGVWVWKRQLRRYVSLEHPNGMKLKESQVRWIVREKRRNEKTNAQIDGYMGVTIRWVQKLWVRHKDTPIAEMSHPAPMGRPENSMPGRRGSCRLILLKH